MPLFNELYQEAYNLFKLKNYEEATIKLVEAENEYHPGDEIDGINKEDIDILKGTIGLATGKVNEAQLAFENALKVNPHSIEAAMGLGQMFYMCGMLNEAQGMYTWIVENDPENEVALNSLELLKEEADDSIEEIIEVDDQISSMFEEAYELFLDNNFDNSLEKVEDIENKFNEEINLLKGNIFLGQKKYEKALLSFKQVLEISKNCAPACNGLGEVYVEMGQLEDAKIMFEYAIKINPNDQYALLGLAEVNNKLGHSPLNNMDGFFGNLKISEELKGELNAAYSYFEQKEYIKSINKINEIVTSFNETEYAEAGELRASLMNFKGFNYLSLEEKNEAKEMFEAALQFNPESSQACAGLGEIAFLNGDDETAKTMFEWAVKNNSRNVFAIAGLAKVNIELDLPEEHNTLDSEIVSKIGDEFEKFIGDAYELFNSKEYSKALELLYDAEKYIDKSSDKELVKKSYSSVENFKGFCYLSLNDIDNAQQCFERSLSVNSKSSQACAGLGEIFYLEENDQAAREMFEWALRNEPGNKFAKAGLEKVLKSENLETEDIVAAIDPEIADKISGLISDAYDLYSQKEFDNAIQNLTEAEKIVKDHYDNDESYITLSGINNFLGFNYLCLGDNEKAKGHYEKSLEFNPESSQASAGLGEIFFQNGEDEASKQMFEFAVKYNPENKYAETGLAKVNKILGYYPEHNTLLV